MAETAAGYYTCCSGRAADLVDVDVRGAQALAGAGGGVGGDIDVIPLSMGLDGLHGASL